jgi:hypothetical protein
MVHLTRRRGLTRLRPEEFVSRLTSRALLLAQLPSRPLGQSQQGSLNFSNCDLKTRRAPTL